MIRTTLKKKAVLHPNNLRSAQFKSKKLLTVGIVFLLLPMGIVPLSTVAAGSTSLPNWSSIPLGSIPRGVSVNPASGVVYAVMYLNGTTFAIDSHSLSVSARIPTPSPYAVAVDSKTDKVYVSQGHGSSIAVINGSTNTVIAQVPGAGTPYALAVDEARDLIFAVDTGASSLWAINGSTNDIVARVPVRSTSALAVDPLAGEAFVGNLSSNLQNGTVDVLNEGDLASTPRTIPVPFPPMHYSVDPALHLLFVTSGVATSGASPNFLAINDETLQVVYAVNIGDAAPDISVVAQSQGVYVSDAANSRIYELDEKGGQLLQNFSALGGGGATGEVTAMAFNPSDGRLYVTETDDTSLLALSPPQAAPSTGPSALITYSYVVVLLLAVGAVISIGMVRRRSAGAKRRAPGTNSVGAEAKHAMDPVFLV